MCVSKPVCVCVCVLACAQALWLARPSLSCTRSPQHRLHCGPAANGDPLGSHQRGAKAKKGLQRSGLLRGPDLSSFAALALLLQ